MTFWQTVARHSLWKVGCIDSDSLLKKKNERGKEEGKGRVQSLGSSNVCKRLQHDQYEGCKNFGSNLKDNKEKMQEIVAIRDDNCKIFYPGE